MYNIHPYLAPTEPTAHLRKPNNIEAVEGRYIFIYKYQGRLSLRHDIKILAEVMPGNAHELGQRNK